MHSFVAICILNCLCVWLRAADLGRQPVFCVVQAVAKTALLTAKLSLAVDQGVAALAGVAKLVYAPDLGSGGLVSWGFKSLRPHHIIREDCHCACISGQGQDPGKKGFSVCHKGKQGQDCRGPFGTQELRDIPCRLLKRMLTV